MLRYEEYKESGAEWIGAIPSTWEVGRLKKHLKRTDARNPGSGQVLSLYRELGIIPKDSRDDNHNVTSEDTSKYKYVQPGDFVVNKMKAWQGSVAVSDYEGIVSPAYYVYKFLDDRFHKRYFHYLIRSCYKEEFMRLSAGIRIGQWDLSSEDLDCVPVLLPSMDEQIAIAKFLDEQIAHIDSVIAEAKASIEEYKAWKASIIYEAVTKGLDPNVEMKDSGIEWIGDMPIFWKIRKIAWDYSVELGKMLDAKRITGTMLHPYLRNADVQWGYIKTDNLNVMDFEPNEYERYSVKAGDLMVCEGGEIGRCAIVPNDFPHGIYYQKALHRIRPLSGKNGNNRYLFYLLYAMAKYDLFTYDKPEKSTIAHLPGETLVQLRIPSPSVVEQNQIAEKLDKKVDMINALVAEKEKLIADLEAYKKSLIFEVVTGKRRVC